MDGFSMQMDKEMSPFVSKQCVHTSTCVVRFHVWEDRWELAAMLPIPLVFVLINYCIEQYLLFSFFTVCGDMVYNNSLVLYTLLRGFLSFFKH